MGDLEERRHGVLPLEGAAAGDELGEHAADAEEVAPPVDLAPAHLLRGHVGGGAEHHPGRGHGSRGDAGDPEIRDLGGPLFVDEEVGGLDVAVDDPDLVGVAEALEHLMHDGDPGREGQGRTVAQGLEQVAALEELHHDVGRPVGVIAEVEDGHHVRVHHAGHRPGLALEALLVLGVVRDLGEHDLQGHVALEERVVRVVDRSHGSLAQEPDDLVLADAPRRRGLRQGRSFVAFAHRGHFIHSVGSSSARQESLQGPCHRGPRGGGSM